MTYSYRRPYDWESLARFLAVRAGAGVELVDDHRYARTFEIDGEPGHLEVTPSLQHDRFEVAIHVRPPAVIPALEARIRRLLDLDADPAVIAAVLGSDPALQPMIATRPGLRLPGAWDGFEIAVRAILGQQVTVAAATKLAGRLIATFGREYAGPPGLTHLFPTAERLRDADIASIGMPKARGAAISALATAAVHDPTLFHSAQDPVAAIARFRAIRGIGEWTAQYIAMRALHASDAFPAGDVALQRALAMSARELETRADAWRPWRAYAAIHLWTSL